MASPSQLSDAELREKLKLLGEEIGPITGSTRRVYQRRLETLVLQQKRSLNALSSDDSETERSTTDRNQRKKRFNHRASLPVFSNANKADPVVSKENEPLRELFKTPLMSTPRYSSVRASSGGTKNGSEPLIKNTRQSKRSLVLGKNRSASSKMPFEVETSDSERDTDSVVTPMRTLQLRNMGATTTNHVDTPFPFKRSRKSFSTSTPNGENLSPRQPTVQQHDWRKHQPSLIPLAERKCFSDFSLNGYVSDPLNREFQGAKSSGKSTNYSHCVSWMLVLGMTTFFVIIGVFYMSTIQKMSSSDRKSSSLDYLKCEMNSNKVGCIPAEYYTTVLKASHVLHDILSAAAGKFECQDGRESRNISVHDAKVLLKHHLSDQSVDVTSFDQIFNYTISLTLENPNWGIKVLSGTGEVLTSRDVSDLLSVRALESERAAKSLWCRLQHSFYWTLTRLVILFVVAMLGYLVFIGCKMWKKRKELQEKELYDLVEKIIDILQRPLENASTSPSIPVANIRDQLIPIKHRKEKNHLWEKAVSFIEENESRVEVGYERIKGAEHKIWRWLPSPTDESEAGKHGKVWQGQAFGSKAKNNVSYSPTPCLKIRNMFDPAVEYGDNWQVCVQDAILEKCEGNNGIVHIAIDTSSNEGCTYMLCDSSETAGKAYEALHGWWFDGKLVTVKYLRLQRYLERFPEAETCDQPLKPSNNKRLSLSTPFFSSALERS